MDKEWFEDCPCTCLSALVYVCSLPPICSLCSEACGWATTVFVCMMSAFPVLVLETNYSSEAAISPLNSREVPSWFWSISVCLGKKSHLQNCLIASWLVCRLWGGGNKIMQVCIVYSIDTDTTDAKATPVMVVCYFMVVHSYLPISNLPVSPAWAHIKWATLEDPQPMLLVGSILLNETFWHCL